MTSQKSISFFGNQSSRQGKPSFFGQKGGYGSTPHSPSSRLWRHAMQKERKCSKTEEKRWWSDVIKIWDFPSLPEPLVWPRGQEERKKRKWNFQEILGGLILKKSLFFSFFFFLFLFFHSLLPASNQEPERRGRRRGGEMCCRIEGDRRERGS